MKKMIFFQILVLFFGFLLVSCNLFKQKIEGTGEDKQVIYEVNSIDSLYVDNIHVKNGIVNTGASVNIYNSDTENKVIVVAEDPIIEYIKVSTNNGKLKIYGSSNQIYVTTKIQIDIYGCIFKEINVSNATKLNAFASTLDTKDLSLTASGASKIKIYNSHEIENVKIDLSGASILDINYTKTNKIEASLSGSSTLKYSFDCVSLNYILSGASIISLTGLADDMSLKLSGASTANCKDLVVNVVDLNLSGASTANVTAQEIKGSASGASKITYYSENPKIKVDLSDSSTIDESE